MTDQYEVLTQWKAGGEMLEKVRISCMLLERNDTRAASGELGIGFAGSILHQNHEIGVLAWSSSGETTTVDNGFERVLLSRE